MSATKFFDDNLKRLGDPAGNEAAWNLSAGLKALAQQLDRIEHKAANQERQLQQIEAAVRALQSR